VHDHTPAPVEVEAVADAGGPAVIEEHDGIGVEERQVVDEVEHAPGSPVHEAGNDMAAHPRKRTGQPHTCRIPATLDVAREQLLSSVCDADPIKVGIRGGV